MGDSHDPIFRAATVERYIAARGQEILPEYLQSHRFRIVWLVTAILLLAITAIVALPIPSPVEGIAITVDSPSQEPVLIVMLPSASGDRSRPDQTLYLELNDQRVHLRPSATSPDQPTVERAKQIASATEPSLEVDSSSFIQAEVEPTTSISPIPVGLYPVTLEGERHSLLSVLWGSGTTQVGRSQP